MEQLTTNFNTKELGVENAEARIKENARILCIDILEPIRTHAGPTYVHDGYRDTFHNQLVHGVSNSFHLYENDEAAADISFMDTDMRSIFDWIRLGSNLPFDKVILELAKQSMQPAALHIQYHCIFKDQNKREAFEGFTYGEGDYTRVAVI